VVRIIRQMEFIYEADDCLVFQRAGSPIIWIGVCGPADRSELAKLKAAEMTAAAWTSATFDNPPKGEEVRAMLLLRGESDGEIVQLGFHTRPKVELTKALYSASRLPADRSMVAFFTEMRKLKDISARFWNPRIHKKDAVARCLEVADYFGPFTITRDAADELSAT
jgi:hypothetical protein